MIRAGRGHRRAAQLGIPGHAATQGGGQSPQGDVGPATLHKDLAAVCTAVDRHGISGRVCGDGLAAGGGGSHLSAAVPPDAPAAEGIQQSPEGNIGHAALQVVDALTQNGAVHLDGYHPAGGRLDGGAGQGKGGQQAAEKFSFHGENSSFLVCRCCTRAYRREGAGCNPQNIPELEANRQLDNIVQRYYSEPRKYRVSILGGIPWPGSR